MRTANSTTDNDTHSIRDIGHTMFNVLYKYNHYFEGFPTLFTGQLLNVHILADLFFSKCCLVSLLI